MAAASNMEDRENRSWFSKIQDTLSLAVTSTTRPVIDKKTFEKAWRQLDKVGKLCQNSRLNLKNSPPFMLDILPDTYQHLKSILQYYEDKFHVLNDCEYFKIYLENLDRKCKAVLKLFRDNRERMFDERDISRRKLTKLSLIFSHMLADLKAIFPDGIYIGSNFKINKADATEFWNKNFGPRYILFYLHITFF